MQDIYCVEINIIKITLNEDINNNGNNKKER